VAVDERSSGVRRRAVISGAALSLLPWKTATAQRPRTPHLAVLIPGIMGSVLHRGDDLLWGVGVNPLIDIIRSGDLSLSRLRLDAKLAAPEPAIRATALFPSTTLIPGFWKHDGYSEIRNALVNELGLVPGSNYFEFPYDWRMDNRLAARQLAADARRWLANWRDASRNAEAKLILVCHSMGGLVARYACEVLGLRGDVRHVFTIGAPYQGSYKALERVINGFVSPGLTQTLLSFDSTYQLLPTYACIDPNGKGPQPLRQIQGIWRDRLSVDRVLDTGAGFHEECRRAALANRGQTSDMQWHVSQASTHATPQIGEWRKGMLSTRATYQGDATKGDGTVPGYVLAQPDLSSVPLGVMHCNQLHASMQNDSAVLRNIIDTIRTGSGSQARSGDPVSLTVPDVVRKGEKFKAILAFEKPADSTTGCSIVDVATGDLVEKVEFRPKSGQQDLDIDLTLLRPGVFRFNVLVRGATLCSDLIAVVEA